MDCEIRSHAEEANPEDREERNRKQFPLRETEAQSAGGAGWREDGEESSLLPSSRDSTPLHIKEHMTAQIKTPACLCA